MTPFEEQDKLLEIIQKGPIPSGPWPKGCYGSRHPWLTFVGPSPGGKTNPKRSDSRGTNSGELEWDKKNGFIEPLAGNWSPGFRVSYKPLVETIMDRTKEEGAFKLVSFLNFDWEPTPDAKKVPAEWMRAGVKVVLEQLEETTPHVIAAMTGPCFELLKEGLANNHYEITKIQFGETRIRTMRPSAYHRGIDICKIEAVDENKVACSHKLHGSFLLRCPQHPAKIWLPDYAERIARALARGLTLSMTPNATPATETIIEE